MPILVSSIYLQTILGAHIENAWKMGDGDKWRTPPRPGGMSQSVRSTITLKTRWGKGCVLHSFPLGFNAENEVSILQFVSFSRRKSSRKTIRDYFLDYSWSESVALPPSVLLCNYICFQEDEMLRHTALRLISVIGYSLSLVSLILATLLMGMLRFETIF